MHAARGGPPDGGGGGQAAPSSSSGGHHLQRPNLKTLDLKSLPREDGPPSETQLRRQKYLFFEKQCSRVQESLPLFLSGDYVARNKAILDENGITHVVNCVGFVSKEYFKGELQYRTLYLQDTPAEDILCVLYDTFDFIDRALRQGGHVLVHCSQGVSRSATIVIAYLMWRTGKTYDEVFAQVKSRRGVTNPNIGFTCQMLQWQKRRRSAPTRTRLYRIAPHCSHAPTYLVPKIVTPPKKYPNNTYRELDPRGAFVIHTPSRIYVWRGAACPPAYARAAEHHANLLLAYETYTGVPLVVLDQGDEDDGFVELLDPDMLDPEQERINARRASITGDVILMTPSALTSLDAMDTSDGLSSVGATSAPVSVDLAPAANAGSTAMDISAEQVDIPRHSGLPDAPLLDALAPIAVHSGSSGGHGSLSASTSLTQLPGQQQQPQQHHQQPYAQAQPGSRSQGQQQLPPVSTLRHNSSSGRLCITRWRPSEVEEYSDEYTLYLDAMRKGGGGDTSSDSTLGVRMSYDALYIGGDCGTSAAYGGRPLSALMGHAQHLDDSVRPESPASVEGRMKKYRRGTSEYGQAPSDKSKRLFPSLHTSIDEDNFNC